MSYSFAGKFKVKATEGNTVGLEKTEREGAIHIELVLAYSTKLHINFVVVVLVDQLEVFHTRFIDSPIKIEDEGLHLFVPLRGLIKIKHHIFCFVVGKLPLNCFFFNFTVRPHHLLTVSVHHGQQNFHPTRAL